MKQPRNPTQRLQKWELRRGGKVYFIVYSPCGLIEAEHVILESQVTSRKPGSSVAAANDDNTTHGRKGIGTLSLKRPY